MTAAKETGMIFNGAMVRAILEGRKTQTRRPIKELSNRDLDYCQVYDDGMLQWREKKGFKHSMLPCNKPGDRLWVRETWGTIFPEDVWHKDKGEVHYRATEPTFFEKWKAYPSIHMPRWAARITLEITSVRVERLQEIDDEDVLAEGISCHAVKEDRRDIQKSGWKYDREDGEIYSNRRDAYKALWNSIYAGLNGWSNNPWVLALEFRVL